MVRTDIHLLACKVMRDLPSNSIHQKSPLLVSFCSSLMPASKGLSDCAYIRRRGRRLAAKIAPVPTIASVPDSGLSAVEMFLQGRRDKHSQHGRHTGSPRRAVSV